MIIGITKFIIFVELLSVPHLIPGKVFDMDLTEALKLLLCVFFSQLFTVERLVDCFCYINLNVSSFLFQLISVKV